MLHNLYIQVPLLTLAVGYFVLLLNAAAINYPLYILIFNKTTEINIKYVFNFKLLDN
jgi:hypothetical protein